MISNLDLSPSKNSAQKDYAVTALHTQIRANLNKTNGLIPKINKQAGADITGQLQVRPMLYIQGAAVRPFLDQINTRRSVMTP